MAKAKTLVCRFCGDELEQANNRDHLSGWTHSHPSLCPYRQDRMPSLNGVHVGDVWRNLHTKEERTIAAIRLGGCGTYTDREPVIVWDEDRDVALPNPLWSLVEHWEPVTRPGEYPVPWTRSRRFRGGRSCLKKWRGPAHRGRKSKAQRAYWHAYHSMATDYSSTWASKEIWQMDPELERKREERVRALAYLDTIDDPYIADVVQRTREMFSEAA